MHQIGFTICAVLVATVAVRAASSATASNNFVISLSPPTAPDALLADSPFGINTAFNPGTSDLDARLAAMQQAGIKWGRQDFTWRRIEKSKANTIGAATTRSSKNVARAACRFSGISLTTRNSTIFAPTRQCRPTLRSRARR